MSQDSQAPVVEHPSVLLAFIHDEPALSERLALSQGTKQGCKERLKNMEKKITKLVDIVEPNSKSHTNLPVVQK